MVQEDRKIRYRKHKWMDHVLRDDGLLRDVLEATTGKRIQLIHDFIRKEKLQQLKTGAFGEQ